MATAGEHDMLTGAASHPTPNDPPARNQPDHDQDEDANLRATTQAEGDDDPGELDIKVGRTPGQAEGDDDPEETGEPEG